MEEPPGTLDTIVGEHTIWHHDPSVGLVVARERIEDVGNPYTNPRILERRSIEFWRGLIESDTASIMASVTGRVLHDRSAIAVTLPGKGGDLRLTADKRTGVWLEALMNGEPWLDWEWVVFDDVLDDALFRA